MSLGTFLRVLHLKEVVGAISNHAYTSQYNAEEGVALEVQLLVGLGGLDLGEYLNVLSRTS